MLSRPGEIRIGPMHVDKEGEKGLKYKSLYLNSRDMSSETLADDLLLALDAIKRAEKDERAKKDTYYHACLSEISPYSAQRHILEVKDGEVKFRQEWYPANSKRLLANIKAGRETWQGDEADMHKWG